MTNKLTQWVIDKIEKDYKDDVDLLIGIQGHSIDGDQHGVCFDFFVPATERGCELTQTFIIDGVGHDLYPRSWQRLENSVNLNDMCLLLDQATILWAKDDAAVQRFEDCRRRMLEHLKDDSYVYGKALECMDKALEIYRSVIFEEKIYRVRSEINCIHEYLSKAVAFMNHTYAESAIFTEVQAYNDSKDGRLYYCPEMKIVPDGFFSWAGNLLEVTDVEKLKAAIFALLKTTREFILARKPAEKADCKTKVDYEAFLEWYQEMSLTWKRLRYFCDNNMVEEAYTDACYLQEEFLYIAQDFKIEELNLLDSFNPKNLSLLRNRADQLEKIILDVFKVQNIQLKSYASVDDFLEAQK